MRTLCGALVLLALGCGSTRHEDRTPKSLALVPLGKVESTALKSLKSRLEATLPVVVSIGPSVALPTEAYTKPRNRYRADKLLVWLAKHDRADIVLGVTNVDISTSVLGHDDWGVFGRGYCPGRAAVVSSFQLGKKGGVDPRERLERVAIHEVGHTLGLPHCPRACIMADAKGKIKSVDTHSEFCGDCRTKLGR